MEFKSILIISSLVMALGIVHWGLAPMALQDLIKRQRVIGGRKGLWAVAILSLTCVGSLLYFVIHPELQEQQ